METKTIKKNMQITPLSLIGIPSPTHGQLVFEKTVDYIDSTYPPSHQSTLHSMGVIKMTSTFFFPRRYSSIFGL